MSTVFWDVTPRALVRTEDSEKRIASIFRVKIQRTRSKLAVTSKCSMLRKINHFMRKEAIEWDIPPKRQFLQDLHDVTSQRRILHSYRRRNLKSLIYDVRLRLLNHIRSRVERQENYIFYTF
jgi:hypothetical protein